MSATLLRRYVQEILTEAPVTSNEASKSGLALLIDEKGKKKTLVLFDVRKAFTGLSGLLTKGYDEWVDAFEPAIVGFIQLNPSPKGPQWGALNVTASAASKGHGPLMYDIAMSLFGKITADRHWVSPSAQKVWAYYDKSRSDVKKYKFDDVLEPKTPDPDDDAVIQGEPDSPVNAAYEGAHVDVGNLKLKAELFFTWAKSKQVNVDNVKKAMRHAGSGFFRQRYLHG